MSTMLFSITSPPRKTSAKKHPTLILLHGRGTDEEDLMGLVPFLDERLNVVSVRAPYRFSFGGCTWFQLSAAMEPDRGTLEQSYQQLVETVESIKIGRAHV